VLIQRKRLDGVGRSLSNSDEPDVCRRILTSHVDLLTGQFVEFLHPIDCRRLFRGIRPVFDANKDL
jgi:hypothetical protein